MAATSVPHAQDALLAAIVARSGLDNARVQLGLPGDVPRERERIYIDDMEDLERERIAEQDVFRETYVLPVIVEVRTIGADTRSTCRDRAYAISDLVDAAVTADRELAGAAHDSLVEGIAHQLTRPMPDGWITYLRVNVRVLTVV